MKALIASGLALLFSSARADTGYQFRIVDFPGAAATVIYAVNDRSQLVGTEQDAAGRQHAIFDDGRQLQLLDPAGPIGSSSESWAYSINNREDIAGAYTDAAGIHHGYVHHADGTLTTIDFPGAAQTQAFGVNDLESVIGVYSDANKGVHAFVRRDGHYRNIDLPGAPATSTMPLSINDFGLIVGEYIKTPGTNGFGYLQTPDGHFTLTTAPGSAAEQTYFISINNRLQILGSFADASGGFHNFLKTGSAFRSVDLPARLGASFVSAQTVNDLEEIVGYYLDASSVSHGFVAIPARHRH